jgi:SWI/SNF-related matrix-associated actin-dependent regulator 1 of chromatin subfamily A
MPNEYTPFPFQATGVDWLRSQRTNGYGFTAEPLTGLLGDEMGLGKTAQALLALKPEVIKGKRFLLLVPGATLPQWQRNWDRWILDCEPDEFGADGLYALRGSESSIPKGFSCIASHSMMAKAKFVEACIAANFDGCIIDEAHKFGGRDTKRIKHLWVLRNLSKSKFQSARIALTGTPTRNYAGEIYNLLHFIAPHQFRNTEAFDRKYLTFDGKSLWNVAQFHADIKPFYLRRTVAEVQKDLPKHRITKLYTDITDPYIKMLYNKEVDALENFMERGSMLSTETSDGPQSLLGYLVKLRHLTGIAKAKEPSIIEPISDYLVAASQRVETTNDSANEVNGNKVAIGLIHRLVADRLEKSLINEIPDLKIQRLQGGMTPTEKDNSIKSFIAEPAPCAMLCNMEAGGAGIDGLQTVCSRSYVFERMWNGADEEQFEKRISRTGQKWNTETVYTIASGTIDEFFDDMVEQKRKITGNVHDEDWELNGKAMRDLAQRIVMGRL